MADSRPSGDPSHNCIGEEDVELQPDTKGEEQDTELRPFLVNEAFELQQLRQDDGSQEERCLIDDASTFDIFKATQHGARERVEQLVEGGFDVNQRDEKNATPLHWAAMNNE